MFRFSLRKEIWAAAQEVITKLKSDRLMPIGLVEEETPFR
jgi:hypothetical protein